MRSKLYAVKISGPRFDASEVYWKQPGSKRRAVFDSQAEAMELAEREGGRVVCLPRKEVAAVTATKKRPATRKAVRRAAKPGMGWLFMEAIDRAVREGRRVSIVIEPTKFEPNATLSYEKPVKEKP